MPEESSRRAFGLNNLDWEMKAMESLFKVKLPISFIFIVSSWGRELIWAFETSCSAV